MYGDIKQSPIPIPILSAVDDAGLVILQYIVEALG
jgi:hypothetical protein